MSATTDAIVVGGGVIGVACALALTDAGATVRLLEQGRIAGGASSVAGALLATALPTHLGDAEHLRHVEGTRSVADYAVRLSGELGIDVEHRVTGALRIADEHERDELKRRALWSASAGFPARWLDAGQVHALEPQLIGARHGAIHLPSAAHVRSRRLVEGLAQLARAAGAVIEEHVAVLELRRRGRRVTGVDTADGPRSAGHVVVATGAAPEPLTARAAEIRPVRGQTLEVAAPPEWLHRIVVHPRVALLPRADGNVMIGATVEPDAGYDTTPRLAALVELVAAAAAIAPSATSLEPRASAAALRPAPVTGRPLVGPVEDEPGLLLALGHHRAGIMLSAPTAAIIADHVRMGGSSHPASATWHPAATAPAA